MVIATLRSLGMGLIALSTAVTLTACSSTAPEGESAAAPETTSSGGDFTVTDVAGRQVTFDQRPERVLLAEGRGLFATALLNQDDPTENVVAIGTDLHEAAPTFEEKLSEVDKDYADLPTIGNIADGDVTVENLLAHKPDVVVMTLDHKKAAEKSGFLTKLDKAGLAYVFTDFRQKPLENTPKSITLFGQLFDKEDKAAEFNKFYTDKVQDITERAESLPDKPSTFLWRAAGLKDCCATVKDSNLGDLINAAGGKNLGDELLDGESGDLTAEKILEQQPEHIIATGGAWAKDPKNPEVVPHVEMGYNAEKDVTEKTLIGLLDTPGFDTLNAPKEGHLHAAYHQFYDSPFNVFALEQFAKWIHPEEFKDLNPEQDFAEFHQQWLPFDLSGTFFATAQPTTE